MAWSARQWFDVHSFAGVFTGMMLFLICWSGTVATLSYEIDWLVTPEMRVGAHSGAMDWNTMADSVLKDFPEANVQMIRLPVYERSAVEVVVRGDRIPRTRAFVDPSTNEVLAASSMANVQRFFRSFHRRLFLPNPLGIFVVSLFAISLAVSVFSALSFYKRWWSKFFRFKPGRNKAWVSELHKTGGLWAMLFGILIAVTGIWYGLEATGMPHKLFADKTPNEQIAVEDKPVLTLNELVGIVRQIRPDIEVRQIFPPGSFFGDDRLKVTGKGVELFLRDRVNAVTVSSGGQLIRNESGTDIGAYEYWVNMADPLHFGNFAGLPLKVIWCLFGLLLCGLCLTGLYLHAKRLSRQGGAGSRAHWRGTMAALCITVMVVIISMPLGIDEVTNFLGYGAVEIENVPISAGVLIFISVWVAITLALIALPFAWLWQQLRFDFSRCLA